MFARNGRILLVEAPDCCIRKEWWALRQKLYLAVLTTVISYALPKLLDLLSQVILQLLLHLFR